MKPGMKMMMMDRLMQPPESNRSEYGGGNRRMIGYDRGEGGNATTSNYAENRMEYGMEEMENRRRRDSRGRYMEGDGWEYNRNYPRPRYEPESRRRRDSRGRYALNMGDDEDEEEMRGAQTWYPPYGNMPPANMYPMNMHHPGNSYGDIYAEGTIYTPGAMNKPMGMHGDMSAPVDEHTARMWVQKMDGGEKFKPEQTEQFRMSHCPDCTKWEYYVAVNAMYSDYCETAKKMGMDKPEFYAMLAKDFLKDKDAKPHKLRNYMENVPK